MSLDSIWAREGAMLGHPSEEDLIRTHCWYHLGIGGCITEYNKQT